MVSNLTDKEGRQSKDGTPDALALYDAAHGKGRDLDSRK